MKKPPPSIPGCNECTNRDNLFCTLSSEEKEFLSEGKGQNFFRKGQTIFYEGNHPHGLYCVYQGKIKLYKMGDNGKEQIVRLVGTGDLLGYRSLLSNESYRATATVLEDSYLCLLSKRKFTELLDTNSKLSRKVIEKLSQDLRRSEQSLIDLTQKTVRERIAEALLLLKAKFGVEEDGKTLAVILSRREIGDFVGISTETTIRALSSLNKEGLIELGGKQIRLIDVPQLARVANIYD